jgi:hypothetical protein
MEYSFIAGLAACQGLPIPKVLYVAGFAIYRMYLKILAMMFYEFFICNMI